MSDSRKARTSIFPLHYTYSLIAITPTGIKKKNAKEKKEKINKNQNTQRKERKKTHKPNHIRNIAN